LNAMPEDGGERDKGVGMGIAARLTALERHARASGELECRCSMPILWTSRLGEQRVFKTLRDYYNGTVINGDADAAFPGGAATEAIPERCSECGGLIEWVRVSEQPRGTARP
jgi:hypothetical protein